MVNHDEPIVLRCIDGKSVHTCLGVIWQITAYRSTYRRMHLLKEIAAGIDSKVAAEMCRLLAPYKGLKYRPRNVIKLSEVPLPVTEPLAVELKKLDAAMQYSLMHAAQVLGCFRLRDACALRYADSCYNTTIDRVKKMVNGESISRPRRSPDGASTSAQYFA